MPEIDWKKSSRSMANGNCVEVGVWRKAAASMSNSACVEVGEVTSRG
jgi:hypothetical protein